MSPAWHQILATQKTPAENKKISWAHQVARDWQKRQQWRMLQTGRTDAAEE